MWPFKSKKELREDFFIESLIEADNRNRVFKEKRNKNTLFFDVAGAGEVAISKSCHAYTGGAYGFSFDVGWSRFGFSGGVLSS